MDRRDFLTTASAAIAAGAAAAPSAALATDHDHPMPPDWAEMARRNDQIVMVVYPGMTALDLVGPQYMFANVLGAKVHLVGKAHEPVACDTGFSILPTMTFTEAPAEPAVLFVPGGTTGTLSFIEDDESLGFVADRGARATYVTSVCTGSLVLAAAGLLTDYRATSHWVVRDLLRHGGAIPVDQRVVVDRNRVTGAGVSAGLDMGLHMVALMRGPDYAKACQLLAEYDPQPPFAAGTPAGAGPQATKLMDDMFAAFKERTVAVLRDRSRR
ncbi:DJ-1/PfpI family protein [Phreatobacter sp.]|uniref:DJ-1/PfpI family protein n=1 Tax=Phreatobacter sp. TaxID=1966341 RepID=UPI0025EF0581|nr:DJ-1/PfpI family protein [Phreatobacter sp.]